MRIPIKSRNYLKKYLGFLLILGFISLGAIGGCNNNGGGSDSIGSGPGFVSPRGIAVEVDGTLVVTDQGQEVVVRVDPVTGPRDHLRYQHGQWPVKQLAPVRSNRCGKAPNE